MGKDLFDGGVGCCACEEKSFEGVVGLTCADKKNIFTRREQEILDRIRETFFRAAAIKEELRQSDASGHDGALLELERLRKARAELEKERLAAAEERMRLLGHL
jgi:hypothetical protein